MDVPAPRGRHGPQLLVKVGDRVSEGTLDPAPGRRGGALTQPPSLTGQQEPPTQDAADPSRQRRQPAAAPLERSARRQRRPRAGDRCRRPGRPADFDGVHASPGCAASPASSASTSPR